MKAPENDAPQGRWRDGSAQKSPAEALYQRHDGIEIINCQQVLRHDADGINDRREEIPDLQHQVQRDAHIAHDRIQAGQDQAEAERQQGHLCREQERQHGPRRRINAQNQHGDQHQCQHDAEIEGGAQHRCHRCQDAWKIDLVDQHLLIRKAGADADQRTAEELPGGYADQDVKRIGHPIGGKAGQIAQQHRIDRRRHQRRQHDPDSAQIGLFVAGFDVAPEEQVKQIAIGIDLAKVQRGQSPARVQHHRVRTVFSFGCNRHGHDIVGVPGTRFVPVIDSDKLTRKNNLLQCIFMAAG